MRSADPRAHTHTHPSKHPMASTQAHTSATVAHTDHHASMQSRTHPFHTRQDTCMHGRTRASRDSWPAPGPLGRVQGAHGQGPVTMTRSSATRLTIILPLGPWRAPYTLPHHPTALVLRQQRPPACNPNTPARTALWRMRKTTPRQLQYRRGHPSELMIKRSGYQGPCRGK